MRVITWVLAHKLPSILIALVVGGGGTTAAVTQLGSASPPPSATSAVCAPQNVVNIAGAGDGSLLVNWTAPPASCGPVSQYQVKVLQPNNGQGVLATVASSVTSVNLGEPTLRLCTDYKLGVIAVRGSTQSPAGAPTKPAYTYGPPYNASKLVTIVLQGVNSHIASGSYDPYATSDCTSTGKFAVDDFNMPTPLHDMDFLWMNLDSNQPPVSIGAGNNMIDSVASTGGLVLPFSYNGASLSGNTFTFSGYDASTVANSNPETTLAAQLWRFIGNIHTELPDAKILLVGHSNGGLIAEQWWEQYSQSFPDNVVQVFSLDSPINGIFDAGLCLGGPCAPTLGGAYHDRWHNQARNDQYYVALDNQNQLYTPVGSYGDPLYDMSDNGATNIPTDARIGVISQLFWTEPSCANDFFHPFDLNTDRCQTTGRDFIDPCAPKSHPLDIQWGPPGIPPGFGAPGDLWMHSVVKNCSGVIQKVLTYVLPGAAPTPSPAPKVTTTSPIPSPITSACTAKTFEHVLANPIETEVSPAGQPKCQGGYAVMNFNNPAGQPTPFFFSMASGKWVLIEGGNAVPTKACQVIPRQIMSAWGYNCASPAPSPSPSPSQASVAPGHGSPAAAVVGLLESEKRGDWSASTGACSYVQPDAQATCASLEGGNSFAYGHYQIAGTVTQGTEALVEVTGVFSAPGSPTVSNSDPTSGMPGSTADFQTVYDALVASANTVLSPAPCIEVNGQWYANIGG